MLPTFGLMVAGRTIQLFGFEVAGAGVYLLAPSWLWMVLSGEWRRRTVMLGWGVAALLFLSLGFIRLFSVLSFGVPLLLCRLSGFVIWVLTTLMLQGAWEAA